MTDLDQSGDLSFTSASDLDPNLSQKEHDDSAELIDIDELVENLQANVPKWLDGLRRKRQEHKEAQNLVPLEKSLNEVQAALHNLKPNAEEKQNIADAISNNNQIDLLIELSALDKCQYKGEVITGILGTIQKKIDQMALNNYSNLNDLVEQLDKELETKLAARVEEAIHVWTTELKQCRDELEEERDVNIKPEIQKILLEIRIVNQYITVVPALEMAKASLFEQFSTWHAIITEQPRISCTRYQSIQQDSSQTYKDVLMKMPKMQQMLNEAYKAIDDVLQKTSDYVTQWTSYQTLWDLQQDVLFERLGNDLVSWMKVIVDIKKSRAMVDSPDSQQQIHPFVVVYDRVQSKITMKYDFWQREVLQKFGVALGTSMQKFFADISKARQELSQNDDKKTKGSVTKLMMKVESNQEQVDNYTSGQKLLSAHRFPFPQTWLYAEHVEGEWSSFLDVLNRKDVIIQSKELHKDIEQFLRILYRAIPTKNDPLGALELIKAYNKACQEFFGTHEKISQRGISVSMLHLNSLEKLKTAYEELNDLSNVWKSLLSIYENLDELEGMPWLTIQPRKLQQNLEELMGKLKKLPTQFKSYDAYNAAKTRLQNYSKMNILIMELKSEALKDRHWRTLMKEMKVNWVLSELTLGQVWDVDLYHHEQKVKQVLLVAQGELALEEYMRQVREYWTDCTVDLVNYQQKTKLIRGWDDIFNKLKEHMNSLSQMKLSPYYKQFEEDAISWEDKLNRINALFDVWIDVQRRWVYMEGLFASSADIAHLLPSETTPFSMVSNEFLGLMKRVSAAPRVLDVVHIQGAQKILERLAEMLVKIQKALGEYLEQERNSFPRFYFVGDEDLLEILGNRKDLMHIQKHFKKMFSGIMAIEYVAEQHLITAICSREGETVKLKTHINLNQHSKINDWLRKLEQEMQTTLAKLLNDALASFSKFNAEAEPFIEYMKWIDAYPAQIVGIATDVWWTAAIEAQLAKGENAATVLALVEKWLSLLSDSVLSDQPSSIRRKKIEGLITEFVHKKGICRELVKNQANNIHDFHWTKNLRIYFDSKEKDLVKSCIIKMANAQFHYGFEYLGIQEKLVQTPLTDRCYLTMTEALHCRLGGSPFGPAGTGKTESVKSLGHQLGRFVLVFNCDETFDFQAVGRILVGLCQVGAWGCFDEFNRLEERMLSAVSQQIQAIQETVRNGGEMKVDLVGKNLTVNANMAMFITMNPGYSGRSNLPDNLKQLFRSFAMTAPDRELIAEVMLYSQGFQTAEVLANKIVPLFTLCKEQLSNQCHYDFGLRALKYVLVSAGNIKRELIQKAEVPDEP